MRVVIATLFARLIGASGIVRMIAPFASLENAELPTKFVALTLAQTLEPHAKLNGVLLSVVAGKVHCAEDMIVDYVPAQLI